MASSSTRAGVSNVDDPTLPPGSYRLPTLERRPPRVRTPAEGASLQIHQVLPIHKGGKNDEENLITLCIQCHWGRHALMGGAPKDELLNPEYEADLRDV